MGYHWGRKERSAALVGNPFRSLWSSSLRSFHNESSFALWKSARDDGKRRRKTSSQDEPCFIPVTRPQRFILPRNFQSRYRRHLFNVKPLFQLPLARRSLHQLSRFTIHSTQEWISHHSNSVSARCAFKTHIVVIHATTSHNKENLAPKSVFFPALSSSSLLLLLLQKTHAMTSFWRLSLSLSPDIFYFSIHVSSSSRRVLFLNCFPSS